MKNYEEYKEMNLMRKINFKLLTLNYQYRKIKKGIIKKDNVDGKTVQMYINWVKNKITYVVFEYKRNGLRIYQGYNFKTKQQLYKELCEKTLQEKELFMKLKTDVY